MPHCLSADTAYGPHVGDETRSFGEAAKGALRQGAGAASVAVLAYVTAGLVPSLTETYWAPIAAVVVLYPDATETRKASLDRFFGTVLGSVVGWGCASVWQGHILIYGLGVLLAVGLCYLLRLENASRLSAVAVTVITIIPRAEPAYLVAFHRFAEVSYGVLCALLYTLAVEKMSGRSSGRPNDAG
jgi:uncharacterized membrane protein YgaE (UPF0421/DUF939 family)